MNWEIVINHHSSLQEYRLIDNNDCKMVLKYNPRHQSARVNSGNNHRLFFLESTGAFSYKTIFKNEYGMETGNLVYDQLHSKEGSLVIDQKKYHYQINEEKLLIYKNETRQPFINCSIEEPGNKGFNFFSTSLYGINTSCLVLGLCWYLALPVINDIAEFA